MTLPTAPRVTPFRRWLFFACTDAALVVLALGAAIVLRLESRPPAVMIPGLAFLAGVVALGTVGFFHLAGVYRVSWRFFSLRDMLLTAVCIGYTTTLLLVVLSLWSRSALFAGIPRSAALIQAPLAFLAIAGFRLSRRLYIPHPPGERATPTLLVGAGAAGEQVARSIVESSARERYRLVGFVDDDPLLHRSTIHGVAVLGPVSRLREFIAEHRAGAVVIALEHVSGAQVRRLFDEARAAGVREIRVAPPGGLAQGPMSFLATREVGLEDLLGRHKVELGAEEVRAFLRGKRVLVTGGAGTIGAELCRQVAGFGPRRLVVLDTDESRLHDTTQELLETHPGCDVGEALLDVRDGDRVFEFLAEERPDVVLHAAAYKHVPMLERWPIEGLAVNVLGTANVLRGAARAGASSFVLISTDKAVDPCSVMGATKRVAEGLVVQGDQDGGMVRSAVRFGNVLGSRGSVIPTFERQLRNGGPLTVTDPRVERYFMTTSEAVSLVLQAAAMQERGQVYFLDIGKPVRILEMAREFVRLHGLRPGEDVPIVFTGLRPGERLTEQFTHRTDHLAPTRHPQIRAVAGASAFLPADFLDRVRKVVAAGDQAGARHFIREHFPLVGQEAAASLPDAPAAATSASVRP